MAIAVNPGPGSSATATIVACCALILAAALTHLLAVLPHGHDFGFHAAMVESLRTEPWDLPFPPRRLFAHNSGLGSPAAIFYATSPYLPIVGLRILGFGLDQAIAIDLAMIRLAGALGTYLWLRRGCELRPDAAAIGAALFALHPFLLLNSPLLAFRIAETTGATLLPWILLAIDRAGGTPRRQVLAAALGFGALAMTHMISTMCAAVALPAWIWLRRGNMAAVYCMAGGLLGAGLAGWIMLPALTLRGDIDQAAWHASGLFRRHMLLRSWQWSELLRPGQGEEPGNGSRLFWVTLYSAWLMALGLGLAGVLRRSGPVRRAGLLLLALAACLAPPVARLLAHLPQVVVVQFPWRLMPELALFGAAVAAWLWQASPRARRILLPLVLVLGAQIALPWADQLFPRLEPRILFHPGPPAGWHLEAYAPEYRPPVVHGIPQERFRDQAARICAERGCAPLRPGRPGTLVATLDGSDRWQLLPQFWWRGLACEGCTLAPDPETGLTLARGGAGTVTLSVALLPPQVIGRVISAVSLVVLLVLLLAPALRRVGPARR